MKMALVEDYYELNEAEEVSSIWKIIQITFYISAACIGLWCGYTMALLRLKFGDKCYLFTKTNPLLLDSEILTNNIVNWESDVLCDFCQYSMICSFIVATIWATFFLMCGKGGKSLTGLPQPWRIVWPSFIFNFLYFIVALSTAINIQHGTDYFCLRRQDDKIYFKSVTDLCSPLKVILNNDVHITSLQLEIVMKTSWGCAISWLILFLISFFRIVFVTDFDLFKISIFKIGEAPHSKREEVLRITNYEEPRKIHFDLEHNKMASVGMKTIENKSPQKVNENVEKKFTRQYFKNSFIEPNATFYISTDIRMLSRQKKKKSFKSVREVNKIAQNIKSINIQSKFFEKNFEISQLPSLSFGYDVLSSKELYFDRRDDSFNERQKGFTEKKKNLPSKTGCRRKVALD